LKIRKSPIEHTVHKHTRRTGTVVDDYIRGNGEPEVTVPTHKLSGKVIGKSEDTKGHGGFEVFIRYADDTTKRAIFKEKTYLSALPVGIGYADGQIRRITLRKMEPWTTEVK
jgi:hypothetical protein